LNDLLPLPYDAETLALVSDQLAQVQDGLGRACLLENPSSYVGFAGSTMTELQFLNELVDRTGCQLPCDVSNMYVSAHNMSYDAHAYLDGLPADAIGELHLGGFTREEDEATPGTDLLIDTIRHGLSRVPLSLLHLLMRVAIGSVFFNAGLLKYRSWEITLLLFRDEYQVPLFDPTLMARIATFNELTILDALVPGADDTTRHVAVPGHDRGDSDLRLSECVD
jgi:hypothetical protein